MSKRKAARRVTVANSNQAPTLELVEQSPTLAIRPAPSGHLTMYSGHTDPEDSGPVGNQLVVSL